MRVSEIDLSVICDYCRIIEEDLSDAEKLTLDALKQAAISYCAKYTGLTEIQLDEHEDITVAALTLISDMYDNRSMYVDKSNINRTADVILNMHSVNLIPDEIRSCGGLNECDQCRQA